MGFCSRLLPWPRGDRRREPPRPIPTYGPRSLVRRTGSLYGAYRRRLYSRRRRYASSAWAARLACRINNRGPAVHDSAPLRPLALLKEGAHESSRLGGAKPAATLRPRAGPLASDPVPASVAAVKTPGARRHGQAFRIEFTAHNDVTNRASPAGGGVRPDCASTEGPASQPGDVGGRFVRAPGTAGSQSGSRRSTRSQGGSVLATHHPFDGLVRSAKCVPWWPETPRVGIDRARRGCEGRPSMVWASRGVSGSSSWLNVVPSTCHRATARAPGVALITYEPFRYLVGRSSRRAFYPEPARRRP